MNKPLRTLTAMLAITTVIVAMAGAYLKNTVLELLKLYQDESVLTVPFIIMVDDAVKYMMKMPAQEKTTAETETDREAVAEAAPLPSETEMPTIPPTEEPAEPVVITEAWFDDALFIGDSRTMGMRSQRRLGEADYFCELSMSTFSALSWSLSDKSFLDKNLKYVLSNFEYGKIFIHLGLNECGYDHELVITAYQEIVDLILEYQPEAAVVVQAVMTVGPNKAREKEFSLERIGNLNSMLQELAEKNGLHYQDTNLFAADDEGYLRADISNDGCHPHNFGYEEWIEFIMTESAKLGIP